LLRYKTFSLFILLGWSLVSIVSSNIFGFGVENAGVLNLDMMLHIDVPCHD
jgi:hypothetical protein